MFVGHYAAALAMKKVEPNLNVGWTFFSVMLLDGLLGVFVLLDIENVVVPVDYADLHYLTFEFPFSHGFAAAIFWSVLAFWVTSTLLKKKATALKIARLMAIAVFSHFLIDLIVHIPEMPLLGQDSVKVGFGLWHDLYLALGLEILITIAGLVFYFQAKPNCPLRAKIGMPLLIAVLAVLTVTGQALAPAPSDITGPALTWVAGTFLFAMIAYWLDIQTGPEEHRNRRTGTAL